MAGNVSPRPPARASSRLTRSRSHLLALLLALGISFAGVFSHALWTPDEPTGAVVGLNMVRSGDFVLPRLGGEPFLEKPPLYWWVQAAAYQAFGAADWVARLPSALFMTLTLLLVYAATVRLEGPKTGLIALAILGSTLQFNEDMGRVLVDPALVFFVFAAWVAFAVWDEPGNASASTSPSSWAAAAVGLATALAFLSKGWVGCILAVGAPGLYLLARDRRRALPPLLRLAPVVLAAVLVLGLPWAVALWRDGGPEALRECLVGNTMGRLFGTAKLAAYGHRQPFWYYAADGLVAVLPWVLAVPAAWRAAAGDSASARTRRLFLGSAAIGVGLLSGAASKRTLYLLPLLPGMAIAVAVWLTRAQDSWRGRGKAVDRLAARALMVFAGLAPFVLAGAAAGLGVLPFAPERFAPLLAAVRRPPVPVVLGSLALVAGIAGLVLLPRWRAAWRLSTPALPAAWLVAPPLALLLSGQLFLKWALDPVKTLHDTTRALAAAAPGGGPLGLYRPGTREEKIAAIVDYDLGRRLVLVHDADEAAAFLERQPGSALLVGAAELDRLPATLRRTTRLVYDERGRKASPYVVLQPIPSVPPADPTR